MKLVSVLQILSIYVNCLKWIRNYLQTSSKNDGEASSNTDNISNNYETTAS